MKDKYKVVPIVLVLLIFSVVNIFGQSKADTNKSQVEKERVQAEKLWEQIIEAKGGRKQLHSVNNLLLTKSNKYSVGIYFDVFPNKHWNFATGQPTPKIAWVTMLNLDFNINQVANNKGLVSSDKFTKKVDIDKYRASQLLNGCLYLLETKWLQPTPIRITRKTVGKKRLDIVETRFPNLEGDNNSRMYVFVEPETLSVHHILFYYNYYEGKMPLYDLTFENYSTINGIQMPQKVTYNYMSEKEPKFDDLLEFKINIQYDEQLFEKPPSVESGIDAWKPKTKKQTY